MLLNAVVTADQLYRRGYATYLEVISAQPHVLEDELNMTNTRRKMFQTMVDLYRALGGGWE